MARNLSIKEVKQKAGRFCALRERSPNEVEEKIISWGISQTEAHKVVEELSREGYINEQRFANAYCNDKFEFNSWGKQKIWSNIYAHKLPEQVVTNALDRIDPDKYSSRLYELAQRKWERLEQDELAHRKQKTLNYLSNKGFELDLIWSAIAKLESKGL